MLAVIMAPAAVAQADATWTGAATSSEWSNTANWTGATPPTHSNTAAGTLVFPTLGTCGTCYTSHNGLTGISATGLVLSNNTRQYKIQGNRFTVGTGGINYTPGGGTGDVINAPLALSAGAQTWVVGSSTNGYNSLTLLGGITGPTSAVVTISTPRSDVFLDSDMEVGPVTSNGPGTLHIGGAPGTGHPGSVNGTDAQPLTIRGGGLIPNPGSKSGPLTMNTGTTLLMGTNSTNTGTTTLAVTGAASLSSSTTTKTFIDANGSTPGTSFSQLSASGNITLGGKLIVGQGLSSGSCVALNNGDVATLVSTTGTLSGTFSNAPQGAVLTMGSSCQSTLPKVQINYTSSSVTATVVGSGSLSTSTSLAAPSPSSASTNQQVTLTATVSTSSVAPSGTVAFSANGSVISGCGSQPLVGSGSSATASCATSFAASSSPESLTATFNPASGSGQTGSTSSPQSLTVSQGSTSTGLGASDTSPAIGESVTYTATVTPGTTGAAEPGGTVAFQDGGSSISSCSAQSLTGSSTATCTVSYSSAGSHTITASYGGDANFTSSTSSPTTVTVQQATATFPTTAVLDSFSQAPGALSSNWQTPGLQDAGTVSVSASGQTAGSTGASSAIWKATTFGANQEAYLTVPVLPAAGHTFQVGGRVSSLTGSTVSMYFLQVTPSKNLWDLRKKLNGASSTSIKTFTAPFAAGDAAGLQLSGSTITAWHETGGNWTSVGTATDTSITAGGYVVFTLGDTTMRGGAFGGGNGS